jgi:DNA-binding response OmpR family regulator
VVLSGPPSSSASSGGLDRTASVLLNRGMNILIAEDDGRVARFLLDALKAEGHEVYLCRSVPEISECLDSKLFAFDVAILDRMLGGADSLDMIPQLKSSRPHAKILILSAINSAEEKAKALDIGADDYMAKPYSLVELTARLRVLARRPNPVAQTPSNHIQLGNVCLDLMGHMASVEGRRLDLSNKEFQLFLCLMRHPGQVFNKFQLLDRVWNVQADIESNVVESTVRNVRRKLEEAGAQPQLKSRRNLGYWIEG